MKKNTSFVVGFIVLFALIGIVVNNAVQQAARVPGPFESIEYSEIKSLGETPIKIDLPKEYIKVVQNAFDSGKLTENERDLALQAKITIQSDEAKEISID